LRKLNQRYGIFDDKTWDQFGITYSLSQVLFILAEEQSPTAKKLCESLQLEKSTLSRFLDKLQKKKLIKFTPHPRDSRSKLILLTETGNKLLFRLNCFGNERTSHALQGLTSQEVRAIETALSKLEKNLLGKRYL
jgi:DNA-binding MarR family transcriptional regulator